MRRAAARGSRSNEQGGFFWGPAAALEAWAALERSSRTLARGGFTSLVEEMRAGSCQSLSQRPRRRAGALWWLQGRAGAASRASWGAVSPTSGEWVRRRCHGWSVVGDDGGRPSCWQLAGEYYRHPSLGDVGGPAAATSTRVESSRWVGRSAYGGPPLPRLPVVAMASGIPSGRSRRRSGCAKLREPFGDDCDRWPQQPLCRPCACVCVCVRACMSVLRSQ